MNDDASAATEDGRVILAIEGLGYSRPQAELTYRKFRHLLDAGQFHNEQIKIIAAKQQELAWQERSWLGMLDGQIALMSLFLGRARVMELGANLGWDLDPYKRARYDLR